MLKSRFAVLATSLVLIAGAAVAEAPSAAATAPAVASTGAFSMTTSDGVALRADIAGNGLPCLFVHGGPGSGSERIERLAGPVLEQQYRMVWLDQRGSGRSGSAADKNYSIDRVVDDLDEVRAKLGIDRWVVMSHSFGGLIATAYARKYPQHVRGLVLVNSILALPASMESTVSAGYAMLPAATRPPMDPAAPLPQRYGMVMALLGQQKLMPRMMYADPATDKKLSGMTGLATNFDFASSVMSGRQIEGYLQDQAAASADVKVPVLVLPGQDDDVVGRTAHKAFRFPNQQVVVMPGRHYALIENQREFSAALAAFNARLAAQ